MHGQLTYLSMQQCINFSSPHNHAGITGGSIVTTDVELPGQPWQVLALVQKLASRQGPWPTKLRPQGAELLDTLHEEEDFSVSVKL